jgi:5-methylcytosine-specific restriction endonuclease McrA
MEDSELRLTYGGFGLAARQRRKSGSDCRDMVLLAARIAESLSGGRHGNGAALNEAPLFATDELIAVYHNQTAILKWLRSRGHAVNSRRDPTIPPLFPPPPYVFIGKPCPYCGTTMTRKGPHRITRDHKQARSNGGQLTPENRLIVCQKCNSDKSNYSLGDWHETLRKGGDPRAPFVWHCIATNP